MKFLQTSQLEINNDEIEVEDIDVEEVSENVFVIKASTQQKKNSTLELKIVVEKSDFPMPEIRFMDLTPNNSF
ncbi:MULTISPECIES: hypothetical protein [Chryseobacterium]|uniref:hypothetical protein n=1 Tax=Chryseobacterium TaxID=59732 RepID=UPI0019562778|nr:MULTISPECIES: hypothetical protein [Chryseobacterium]MBM7419341.1 hypothetical protein [Chryseobacterium sp. JUb44]MDH6209264.1 hypothetical protein [Chryseobacterium sp. BIGb0186]WSO12107.1 hypothetical protein VUJ64_09385 [Chryseobacterium scophthalmum]